MTNDPIFFVAVSLICYSIVGPRIFAFALGAALLTRLAGC